MNDEDFLLGFNPLLDLQATLAKRPVFHGSFLALWQQQKLPLKALLCIGVNHSECFGAQVAYKEFFQALSAIGHDYMLMEHITRRLSTCLPDYAIRVDPVGLDWYPFFNYLLAKLSDDDKYCMTHYTLGNKTRWLLATTQQAMTARQALFNDKNHRVIQGALFAQLCAVKPFAQCMHEGFLTHYRKFWETDDYYKEFAELLGCLGAPEQDLLDISEDLRPDYQPNPRYHVIGFNRYMTIFTRYLAGLCDGVKRLLADKPIKTV